VRWRHWLGYLPAAATASVLIGAHITGARWGLCAHLNVVHCSCASSGSRSRPATTCPAAASILNPLCAQLYSSVTTVAHLTATNSCIGLSAAIGVQNRKSQTSLNMASFAVPLFPVAVHSLCKRITLEFKVRISVLLQQFIGHYRPIVLRMSLISAFERRYRPIGRCFDYLHRLLTATTGQGKTVAWTDILQF